MSNVAKVAGTAANTLTTPLNVEEVFSTYLYYPTGNTHTVTNGIDLSGEGGLVWLKNRLTTSNHELADTERGTTKKLSSNSTAAEDSLGDLSAFNSDGFSLTANNGNAVYNTAEVASWTFRKAPKFFDVVTYTGDGTSSRAISHSLGATPGCIIIKRTDASAVWTIFHRGLSGGITGSRILFDTSAATSGSNITAVDDSTFTVISTGTNASGATYVAYLFAHNNSDGEFGSTADQDIIKCGSYTGNGSTTGPEIDLGFEPQWVLQKRADLTGNWRIFDNMRGLAVGGNDAQLFPNNSDAEASSEMISLTPTGFQLTTTTGNLNASGGTYIYIAIRRGPMAVPESATDVFAIDTRDATEPGFDSSFPVDFALTRTVNTADNWWAASRLNQGKYLQTNLTNAEASASSLQFDYMDGWNSNTGANSNLYSWIWRRAPSFCDVVCYTGNGTSGRTVSHNLGVAPEMMWVKARNQAYIWPVYHKDLGNDKFLHLEDTDAATTLSSFLNSTTPTETDITLGNWISVNGSGNTYIAYLFATLDGVSKVGSYTGTGAAQNIDCGFTAGARFVLIKNASTGSSDWFLWDSERGITSGDDPYLRLNLTNAEQTFSLSDIEPTPSSNGFQVNGSYFTINASGDTYIFYAIA